VRILTFNCFGVPLPAATRARLATLGRLLDGAGHDIICLQEVQFSGFLPLLRRSFASFPHLIYQPYWHAPKGGLVTLSRWPVERVDFIPFREHGPWWYTPALADWLLHKGMLVTRIVVGGTPVVVVNTHLLANYSGDWSPGNRFARHQREQLQRLVEVVNGVDRRLPLVIAGDFNVPRGAWLYDEFLHATALRDVLAGDDRPTFRQAMLMPGRYARPIDFVFVRPPAGSEIIASARLVFQEKTRLVTGRVDYLSDHYGVEAVIDVIRDA
jgi:endonuclease/exonuclease/phosphatase family metal-dependent hydrolase